MLAPLGVYKKVHVVVNHSNPVAANAARYTSACRRALKGTLASHLGFDSDLESADLVIKVTLTNVDEGTRRIDAVEGTKVVMAVDFSDARVLRSIGGLKVVGTAVERAQADGVMTACENAGNQMVEFIEERK